MSSARDAAAGLVDYDPDVALRLLVRIVEELDGPFVGDPPDLERVRGFLSSPDSRDADRGNLSTREWKVGFARRERMRALGLELAKKL